MNTENTPATVALTNLMRAVCALSATTEGFLALYPSQVWAWTLTVPQGTALWKVVRDFKRFTRRLRSRYADVHMVWTLAGHGPSFHPHYHFLLNGPYSTGVITQLLRGTCFGITYRRALTRQEYQPATRYDYLSYNLYRTRTTNPLGMQGQRLWGVVAGRDIKAAVRRETRGVQLDGPTARLWRKYNGVLLREIEPGLEGRYRKYIMGFYGMADDKQGHEAINVLILSRPRSPRTGRRPLSFAQFRQRILYQRFQRDLPKLKARAFVGGFTVGFARTAAALVMFYAALFTCFLT
jgi:hypothetical protein